MNFWQNLDHTVREGRSEQVMNRAAVRVAEELLRLFYSDDPNDQKFRALSNPLLGLLGSFDKARERRIRVVNKLKEEKAKIESDNQKRIAALGGPRLKRRFK